MSAAVLDTEAEAEPALILEDEAPAPAAPPPSAIATPAPDAMADLINREGSIARVLAHLALQSAPERYVVIARNPVKDAKEQAELATAMSKAKLASAIEDAHFFLRLIAAAGFRVHRNVVRCSNCTATIEPILKQQNERLKTVAAEEANRQLQDARAVTAAYLEREEARATALTRRLNLEVRKV